MLSFGGLKGRCQILRRDSTRLIFVAIMAALKRCVWQDNSTASFGPERPLVPCDTSATISSCCALEDACLSSGACYGNAGLVYRGGCTEANEYGSNACPDYCTSPGSKLTAWFIVPVALLAMNGVGHDIDVW